jgi:murein DD-endopeptidase MepM/ murein hydrolase activator NlpD
MNIQGKNKFVDFMKRFGVYVGVAMVILIVSLTFGIMALTGGGNEPDVPVVTKPLEFSLPMQNASIIKDFSSTELQENKTLNQWEAHLSIDFSSEEGAVFSVLDGTVESVTKTYLQGNIITIKHAEGFISQYSSLGDELLVSAGDTVTAGQKIGVASTSASGETDLGTHLHFTLSKDGKKVDPNNYLDLQNK